MNTRVRFVGLFALVLSFACGEARDGQDGRDGADGASALVRNTTLDPGDQCPLGGTRIDFGVDDGLGGGVAHDGLLQDGEVRATTVDCDEEATVPTESLEPPSGPPPAYEMHTDGGEASDPGFGGNIDIRKVNATYGPIKLFKTGAITPNADAVPIPDASPTGPGTATISEDTILPVYGASPVGIDDGSLFLLNNTLYRRSGGVDQAVVQLVIAGQATLQLGEDGSSDAITISNLPELVIEGTLTTGLRPDNVRRRDLNLFVGEGSLLLRNTGEIDLSAIDADGSTAGAAGANFAFSGFACAIDGTVRTNGGAGQSGGGGGSVDDQGCTLFRAHGHIEARGANALDLVGVGGNGGSVQITNSDVVPLAVGATFNLDGGLGRIGGDGGSFHVFSTFGDVESVVSGSSNGSDAISSCEEDCKGGVGGTIVIEAHGGRLRHNGNLSARGGCAPAVMAGKGGAVTLQTLTGTFVQDGMPPGSVYVSGNLDVSGGATGIGVGGWGGDIMIRIDAGSRAAGQEIVLEGYSGIHLRGGDSPINAGGAGIFTVQVDHGGSQPDGPIVNYIDILAHGGVAENSEGGNGGLIVFRPESESTFVDASPYILNAARISTLAGAGGLLGGTGGVARFFSRGNFENRGTIETGGGDAQFAGNSRGTFIVSDFGEVLNSGVIAGNGGNSAGVGGFGGAGYFLQLYGSSVRNTGTISMHGGSADASSGTGGTGGTLSIHSRSLVFTNTGTVDVSGGTANQPGPSGRIVLNGAE